MDYIELSMKYAYSQSLKLLTVEDFLICCVLFLGVVIVGHIYASRVLHVGTDHAVDSTRYCKMKRTVFWLAILIPYIYLVLTFTVFNRPELKSYLTQLMPFWTIREVIKTGKKQLLLESLLNVLMLVPFGFILKKLEVKLLYTLLLGAIFSYTIEISQLVLQRGLFELFDDPFHNVLGVAIGWWICKLFYRIKNGQNP